MSWSLRGRLGLLFVAFFLLVTTSVTATDWITKTQAQDALVINLAGRQRMLVQQMTKDALQMHHAPNDVYRRSLTRTAETFDQTLFAFRHGGTVRGPDGQPTTVPAARNPQIVTCGDPADLGRDQECAGRHTGSNRHGDRRGGGRHTCRGYISDPRPPE